MNAPTTPPGAPDARTTVVVITHNRRAELLRTLDALRRLPERPPVIVTDNASTDGTAEAVRRDFPEVVLLRPGRNLGAVGRNLAVRHIRTPYVAFCDDDTWWEPGSLRRAADLLDERPRLAAVTARILVEPFGAEDPVVRELRESPLTGPGRLPGPALGSLLAAATVMRIDAFRSAGGFHPGLWLGGEEELLATDLQRQGWWLSYAEDLTIHHRASVLRDSTAYLLLTVPRDRASARAFADAAAGLPWVLRQRDPVPPEIERRLTALQRARRGSSARKYVG